MPSSDTASLTGPFWALPRSTLDKLKRLHSEVFTKVHSGRSFISSVFVEQMGLTDEKLEQLFDLLGPISPRSESSYVRECSKKKKQSSVDLRSSH